MRMGKRKDIHEDMQMSEEEDDDNVLIRAKGIMDGAKTLYDVIERVKLFVEYVETLKGEGWELAHEVSDDYAFLRKEPILFERRTMPRTH